MSSGFGVIRKLNSHTKCKSAGFSLLEMLISLTIFAIIVIPFVSMPLKAVERSDELQDTSMALQETQHIFITRLKREFGLSKHFLPVSVNANAISGTNRKFDGQKQLFIGFYDPKRQRNFRVGYLLIQQEEPGMVYKLFRAEIPANADLDSYKSSDPDSSLWETAGLGGQKESIRLVSTAPNAPIYFQYCIGRVCNDSIQPKGATGVRIMSSAPIKVKLNKSEVKLPSMYFRLGSDLTKETASLGQYAFPISLASASFEQLRLLDVDAGWPGRKLVTGSTTGGTALDVRDPSYNPKTGNYVLVGQSAPGQANKTYYIMKWHKRTLNYPGFESSANSSGSYHTENPANHPFPVAINLVKPGYPPDASYNFVSVTEDDEGYIYVLVKNNAGPGFQAFVQRYSPSGNFISSSNITGNAVATRGDITAITDAYGIAFTSSSPQEVHVLVRFNNGIYVRTYDKLDNHSDAQFVSHTAVSTRLDLPRVSGTFFTSSTPTGLDIIPEKNFYIISGNSSSNSCRFVSFPINIRADSNDTLIGSPIDRGFLMQTVKGIENHDSTTLRNCNGVAVDPVLDSILTPVSNSINVVGMNSSLNRSFQ